MIGGYSHFDIFPLIDPEVKAVLIHHQCCASCKKYDYSKKSFFCEPRNKVVRKTTGIRLYCFDPIDSFQLADRREIDYLQFREKQNFYRRRWGERNKDKCSATAKKHRLEHLDELHKKAREYRLANLESCNKRSIDFYYANRDEMKEAHLIRYYINRENPVFIVMESFRNFDLKECKKKQREIDRILNMMNVPFPTHLTIDDQKVIDSLRSDGVLGDSSKFYFKR